MGKTEMIIREHLGSEVVKHVEITPDVNQDDEHILRILVVYDQTKGQLSASNMADIIQELWETASESDSVAFPITTFISAEDYFENTFAA